MVYQLCSVITDVPNDAPPILSSSLPMQHTIDSSRCSSAAGGAEKGSRRVSEGHCKTTWGCRGYQDQRLWFRVVKVRKREGGQKNEYKNEGLRWIVFAIRTVFSNTVPEEGKREIKRALVSRLRNSFGIPHLEALSLFKYYNL